MDTPQLIDFCLNSKGSPFDVAQVASRILTGKFRYKGDNTWEYFDGSWIPDDTKPQKIETAVKVDVCQAFMERALHWQEQSMGVDISIKIDSQLRSYKLLELCLKLNKDRFIKDVIKELRAFLACE